MAKGKKKKRIWLRVLLGLAAVLLLAVIGYVLYVMLSYHRLPDDLELEIRRPAESGEGGTAVSPGTDYEIMTYNIGFGAYTPEYSFLWMEGNPPWQKAGRACWRPFPAQEAWLPDTIRIL